MTTLDNDFVEYIGAGLVVMDVNYWMKIHGLAIRRCEDTVEKFDTPSNREHLRDITDMYIHIFDQVDEENK